MIRNLRPKYRPKYVVVTLWLVLCYLWVLFCFLLSVLPARS